MISSKPFTVAVVGGGIAGVALTIALVARNMNVNLYERGAEFRGDRCWNRPGTNTIKAITICDPAIKKAFDKVATSSGVPGEETVWFDFLDGAQGCHRAHFLDECVKLIPTEVTHFRKQLDRVVDNGGKGLELKFTDGSSATADAVIGCDGIRSRVRQLILGEDNPQSYPQYSHVYANRGLTPMDKAIEAMGMETAMRRIVHVSIPPYISIDQGTQLTADVSRWVQVLTSLTYPVAEGKLMNVAAFIHDSAQWSHKRLDVPADSTRVLADYAGWSTLIVKISQLLSQNKHLNCWGTFDLGNHPLSTYTKGRMCLVGDAVHASSPHFGAGAGMGIEDSAVMAELLVTAQRRVRCSPEDALTAATALEAAFRTFDACRRQRTQWMVENSRVCGYIFQWRYPLSGQDAERCKEELEWRAQWIWNVDVKGMVKEAVRELGKRL